MAKICKDLSLPLLQQYINHSGPVNVFKEKHVGQCKAVKFKSALPLYYDHITGTARRLISLYK